MLNTYTKLLKKPISGFADLNLLLSAVMDSSTRTTVCESIQEIVKRAKEISINWNAVPTFSVEFEQKVNKFVISIILKKKVYGKVFLEPEDENCNRGVLKYLDSCEVPC